MALIDKETIRAEIERRIENCIKNVNHRPCHRIEELCELLSFLDTLPEQPVPTIMTNEMLMGEIKPKKKSNALFDKCVENCDPAVIKEVSDNVDKMLGRQPEEGLEEEIEKFLASEESTTYVPSGKFTTSYKDPKKIARHFAEWGEKNAYKAIMKKADEVRDKRYDTDYEVKIEPAAGFDFGCVNVYHEGKLVGQYIEPKEEKKLPEDLEEAAMEYAEKHGFRVPYDGSNNFYDDLDVKASKEGFIAGAEWQKEKDTRDMFMSDNRHFNKVYELGKKDMKEEMMEKAGDGRVIKSYNPVTAIGQPTLHGIELIYPDKGKPYLVAGDKVKIIVIPEED